MCFKKTASERALDSCWIGGDREKAVRSGNRNEMLHFTDTYSHTHIYTLWIIFPFLRYFTKTLKVILISLLEIIKHAVMSPLYIIQAKWKAKNCKQFVHSFGEIKEMNVNRHFKWVCVLPDLCKKLLLNNTNSTDYQIN